MQATRRNLRDEVYSRTGPPRMMYCPQCGAEYSAHSGDYWDVADDHLFLCPECDFQMEIVTRHTVYEEVA